MKTDHSNTKTQKSKGTIKLTKGIWEYRSASGAPFYRATAATKKELLKILKTPPTSMNSKRPEIKRQELKVRTAEVKLEIEKCKLALLRSKNLRSSVSICG